MYTWYDSTDAVDANIFVGDYDINTQSSPYFVAKDVTDKIDELTSNG